MTAVHQDKEEGPRVLIVDHSTESREVLRTVLERRGLRILEASRPAEGLQLVEQHRPQLVVLDVDVEANAGDAEIRDRYDQASRNHNASLVVLGSARCGGRGERDRRFVAKPYHYASLVRTIEQLLHASGLAPPVVVRGAAEVAAPAAADQAAAFPRGLSSG